MTTRTTSIGVLGIALAATACAHTQSNPRPTAADAPAARVVLEASWSPAEAAQRVHNLSEALSDGAAKFDDVLAFAVEAVAGADAADKKLGVDGSVTRIIRAKERGYLGTLRVLPLTATGVRAIELSFDTADHPEVTRYDPPSRAKLELAFGLGASALEYCDARSRSGYRSSLALLESITEEKPLPLGGNLLVDRTGACTWQGIVLRFKKGARNEPPWQEQETELQSRGKVSLADPRARELQGLLDALEKR